MSQLLHAKARGRHRSARRTVGSLLGLTLALGGSLAVVATAQTGALAAPGALTANPDTATTAQDVTVDVDPLTGPGADSPGSNADGSPGTLDPTSVRLDRPADAPADTTLAADGKRLTVPGQGEYTVAATTGVVTFDPVPTYVGTALAVPYSVQDSTTDASGTTVHATASSTITVTVTAVDPTARNDHADTTYATPVTLTPVANDVAGATSAPLVATSVRLTSAAATDDGHRLDTTTGTWVVDRTDGTVLFTPATGWVGTTDPVVYEVADDNGTTSDAELTVTVRPGPRATADTVTIPHSTYVSLDVLWNDTPGRRADGTAGSFDTSSVRLTSARATDGGRTLTVDGQGEWTVDASTGRVRFVPVPAFNGRATPVGYAVDDAAGNPASSRVTITVSKAGSAKSDTVTARPGRPVRVDVLGNDHAAVRETLDPGSVCLRPTGPCEKSYSARGFRWVVDKAGTITVTPPASGFAGRATIAYSVADSSGQLYSAMLTTKVPRGPLPLDGWATPAGYADPAGATAGTDDDLPSTGGPDRRLLEIGLLLLAAGGALVVSGRRRRPAPLHRA